MTTTIQIAQRITEVAQVWDSFLPPGHHLHSTHLKGFEQSLVDDIEPNYIQVFEKEQLVGLVYIQVFQFQHKHLNFSSSRAMLAKAIRLVLPAKLPILVCGHLFRINFQGFYFKDPAHNAKVFDVIRQFRKQKQNCRPSGTIVKDCEEIFGEQQCNLWGYRFFNGDVTMELARRPHWLTFDDYMADLHKNYRQRAKKVLKAFQSISSRLLNAEEILEHAADIERLYWNVVSKQTVKLGIVNARYFYELKNKLNDNFELHALYKEGVMVGFYTFVFNPHDMETHYIGLDYEVNKTHQLYFNILFAGVHKMIEKRLDKLELGRTAREAKMNVGAQPRQVYNYIRVSNPLVNITLSHFLKRFNEMEHAGLIHRNPLK